MMKTLGEVCKTIYRYPQFYGMEHKTAGVPVVRGEHLLDSKRISGNWNDYWFVDKSFSEKFPKTILETGDIVMSVRGSVGKIAYVEISHNGAQISPNLIRISPDKNIIAKKYTFYAIGWAIQRFVSQNTQAQALPSLSASDIKNMSIFCPPFAEQERIAEILSDADAAIATTENLARQLNEQFIGFRNQAMKHIAEKTDAKSLLGDLAKIPQLEAISSAKNKNPLEVSLYCKGIKINSARKIRLSASGRPYFQRSNGDFLIGRQSIHMGGFGFVTPELDGGIASNAITTLRLNPKKINGRFFLHYFSRPYFYRRLEALMDGTAQKEMHEAKIKRIEMPLPDMQAQNEIASAIDGHLRAYQLQQKLAAALKKQKRGLMQQLLTGKIRVLSKNNKGGTK